jgi:hypothetical protein
VDGKKLVQIGSAVHALNAPTQQQARRRTLRARQVLPQFIVGILFALLLEAAGSKLAVNGSALPVHNARTSQQPQQLTPPVAV